MNSFIERLKRRLCRWLCGKSEVVVSGWASASKTVLATDCTNHNGGQVTISVPGSGKVMVNAQAMLGLKSHTQGEIDMMMLHIGATDSDCTLREPTSGYNQMGVSIPKDEASWTADVVRLIPVSVSRTFAVTGAGTKTYYLNGRHVSGSGEASIWESSMQAVFYPD